MDKRIVASIFAFVFLFSLVSAAYALDALSILGYLRSITGYVSCVNIGGGPCVYSPGEVGSYGIFIGGGGNTLGSQTAPSTSGYQTSGWWPWSSGSQTGTTPATNIASIAANKDFGPNHATQCNGGVGYVGSEGRYAEWDGQCGSGNTQATGLGIGKGIGQGCCEVSCGADVDCDEQSPGAVVTSRYKCGELNSASPCMLTEIATTSGGKATLSLKDAPSEAAEGEIINFNFNMVVTQSGKFDLYMQAFGKTTGKQGGIVNLGGYKDYSTSSTPYALNHWTYMWSEPIDVRFTLKNDKEETLGTITRTLTLKGQSGTGGFGRIEKVTTDLNRPQPGQTIAFTIDTTITRAGAFNIRMQAVGVNTGKQGEVVKLHGGAYTDRSEGAWTEYHYTQMWSEPIDVKFRIWTKDKSGVETSVGDIKTIRVSSTDEGQVEEKSGCTGAGSYCPSTADPNNADTVKGFCITLADYNKYSGHLTSTCGDKYCCIKCTDNDCCFGVRGYCYHYDAASQTGCYGPNPNENANECVNKGGDNAHCTAGSTATADEQNVDPQGPPPYGRIRCMKPAGEQGQSTSTATTSGTTATSGTQTSTSTTTCGQWNNAVTCQNQNCYWCPSPTNTCVENKDKCPKSSSDITDEAECNKANYYWCSDAKKCADNKNNCPQPTALGISCKECFAGAQCECELKNLCKDGYWRLTNNKNKPLTDEISKNLPDNTKITFMTNEGGEINASVKCYDPNTRETMTLAVKSKILDCPTNCDAGKDCKCSVNSCNVGSFAVSETSGSPLGGVPVSIPISGNGDKTFTTKNAGNVEVRVSCDNPAENDAKTTITINGSTTQSESFSGTNFKCTKTSSGYECSVDYDNKYIEEVKIIFFFTDSTGKGVNNEIKNAKIGTGNALATFSCQESITYLVSWTAFRSSDKNYQRPIGGASIQKSIKCG